jgi:hypothetical protein
MPSDSFDEVWVALRDVHDAILGANQAATLWFTNDPIAMWPRWYLEVLTTIRSFIGRNQLAYVTSSVTEEPSPRGEVYAFTANLAIHVAVSNGSSAGANSFHGSAQITADAWRRSDLSQVSLLSVEPHPTNPDSFEGDSPRRVEYQLGYPDRVVRVPLVRFPGREGVRSTAVAFSSFVEDLTRQR